MGMGNYANYADTVSDEFVRKTCPDELDKLQIALNDANYSLEKLGDCSNYGGDIEGELRVDLEEDDVVKIMKALNKLEYKFDEMTGLTLIINYHDSEDRGDEVNGLFWSVEGVYQLTPEGKKFQNEIERKFWTDFG